MSCVQQKKTLSPRVLSIVHKKQVDEVTGCAIYEAMARRAKKSPQNSQILQTFAAEELSHAKFWEGYTGRKLKPNRLKVVWFRIASVLFGYTFVLKLLEKDESTGARDYATLAEEIPEAQKFAEEEHAHEQELIAMLDEERLQYVGSMVLGLNDALVELTGTIAGLTFALANTRTIALSGIITGLSATLSMAASNYLAERSDGNPNALKSSLYTGVAYLITVALLVLPYLVFPEMLYAWALAAMIAIVVLVIFVFNYYISVAKGYCFRRRFGEMALISLSVAAISFVIGVVVKQVLGIDV